MQPGTIIEIRPRWQDKGDHLFVWITRSEVYKSRHSDEKANVEISACPKNWTLEFVQSMTPAQRLAALPPLTAWSYADTGMLLGHLEYEY